MNFQAIEDREEELVYALFRSVRDLPHTMQKLSDHNAQIMDDFLKNPGVGYACDVCSQELVWAEVRFPELKNCFLMWARPIKRKVYCNTCQTFDYLLMPQLPLK